MNSALQYGLIAETDEANLIDAISEILIDNNAHNIQTFNYDYWKWQYKALPSGKVYIFVGKEHDKIRSYYHVPIYYGKGEQGTQKEYAVIQDVATSTSMQGKGVFRQIADFANDYLDKNGIDTIYTFPNHRSIHTFLKYNNFRQIISLPSYLLPLQSSMIIRSKINLFGFEKLIGKCIDSCFSLFAKNGDPIIHSHENFNDALENVFSQYANGFKYGLIKDKAYLNWRFVEREKYFIFSARHHATSEIEAVAILKKDEILNTSCLILMDFAYLKGKENTLLELISCLRKQQLNYFGEKFGFMFTAINTEINPSLSKIGFIKIPNKLIPRPLNLLVRSSVQNQEVYDPQKWNITLSDWDVF